jgi:hypothetical protein
MPVSGISPTVHCGQKAPGTTGLASFVPTSSPESMSQFGSTTTVIRGDLSETVSADISVKQFHGGIADIPNKAVATIQLRHSMPGAVQPPPREMTGAEIADAIDAINRFLMRVDMDAEGYQAFQNLLAALEQAACG